jgi:hypothetical protein
MKHIKESLILAKELKLSLKNIKTFNGHDGMVGFNADLYIDNKKTLHVFDDSYGGSIQYTPVTNKQTYKEVYNIQDNLNEQLKQFPKIKIQLSTRVMEVQENLDGICTALISEWEWNKKIKRDQHKGLLIELESGNGYNIIAWKKYGTIIDMINKFGLQPTINLIEMSIQKQLKENKSILNKDYLISLGIKL